VNSMRHRPTVILLTSVIVLAAQHELAAARKIVPLWPGGAPQAKGDASSDTPELIYYPVTKAKPNGAAMIVCPGGGYGMHAIDHEGAHVASWLNTFGVTAYILKYRLRPYSPAVSLLDAQRAVRYVRHNAKELGIDPNRIGIMGFSAGGHLSATLCTNYDSGVSPAQDPIDQTSCRPDFAMLIYPAYLVDPRRNDLPERKSVDKNTPPVFISCTSADRYAPSSVAYYSDCLKAHVDAELHMFGGWGPHGLGLAPGDPAVSLWPKLAQNWLRKQGLLTNAKRVKSVSGTVTISGKPIFRGWIRFTPIDDANKPVAVGYFGSRSGGKYNLSSTTLPCAGEYQAEVIELATADEEYPTLDEAIKFDGKVTRTVIFDAGDNIYDIDLKPRD